MLCELHLNLRKKKTLVRKKKTTLDHDLPLVKLFSDFLQHSDKTEPSYLVLQGLYDGTPAYLFLISFPSLPSQPILHLDYSPGSLASHFQCRFLHLILLLCRVFFTQHFSWPPLPYHGSLRLMSPPQQDFSHHHCLPYYLLLFSSQHLLLPEIICLYLNSLRAKISPAQFTAITQVLRMMPDTEQMLKKYILSE